MLKFIKYTHCIKAKEKVINKYFLGIEIEINHHCNLSCKYCPNDKNVRSSQGLMTTEQFIKILFQLKDIAYEGKISYHFYNEPLLHPEIENFVKLSKEILPKTRSEIFTNGVYLNREKFNSLKLAGVDKFTITQHQGIKKIIFDDVFQALTPEEKSCVKYYNYTQLIYSNRGGLVDCGKSIKDPLNRICLIPSCSLVVTVNGNVVTCYEDYHEKNIMGNIFEEHISKIWEKPKYVEFRNELRKGQRNKYDVCRTCNNLQAIQ